MLYLVPGARYNLVPRAWLATWRSYMADAGKKVQPTLFPSHVSVCPVKEVALKNPHDCKLDWWVVTFLVPAGTLARPAWRPGGIGFRCKW